MDSQKILGSCSQGSLSVDQPLSNSGDHEKQITSGKANIFMTILFAQMDNSTVWANENFRQYLPKVQLKI